LTVTLEPSVAAAIRRILWGTVIIVVDVRVGGFDLVVDAVGAALITWAVVDIHRRFPQPRFESRLMLVAAAITFAGAASDFVTTASAEVTGGRFTLWAAVVSTAQVFGSWALATVFAANLDPAGGAGWNEAARALKLWALPFAIVIDLLAVVDLAQGLFLLFVIPVLSAMSRHLLALGRTVRSAA
jgi:hypothetical protein